MAQKVGDMSRSELAKFVLVAVQQSPATLPRSLDLEDLFLSGDIKLSDRAVATLKQYLGL